MMKKIVPLCLYFLGITVVSAQELKSTDVPAAVIAAFEQSHAAAKEVHWSAPNSFSYRVSFEENKLNEYVVITVSGLQIEHGVQVLNQELPEPAERTMHQHYADAKWLETFRVERPHSDVCYHVILKVDGETRWLELMPDGQLVRDWDGSDKELGDF